MGGIQFRHGKFTSCLTPDTFDPSVESLVLIAFIHRRVYLQNIVGAVRTASALPEGSKVVTVICDGGQRHL